MKKDILYVVILIIGLVLGLILGINLSEEKSTSFERYSLALSASEKGTGFVARMDNNTGDVDVAFVMTHMDKPELRTDWVRIGIK